MEEETEEEGCVALGVVLHASIHTLTQSGSAHKRAALLMELIRRVGGVSSAGSDAVITQKHVHAPAKSAPCIIQ